MQYTCMIMECVVNKTNSVLWKNPKDIASVNTLAHSNRLSLFTMICSLNLVNSVQSVYHIYLSPVLSGQTCLVMELVVICNTKVALIVYINIIPSLIFLHSFLYFKLINNPWYYFLTFQPKKKLGTYFLRLPYHVPSSYNHNTYHYLFLRNQVNVYLPCWWIHLCIS